MTRQPTEIQQRCWAALQEHRSVSGAARALGMSSWSVRGACQAYMVNMGMEGPLPFTKVYARKDESKLVRQLRDRITQLEQELATERQVREHLTELAHPWVAVHQKLDRLLTRSSGVVAPTHRRIADGGIGGKRERRGAAA